MREDKAISFGKYELLDRLGVGGMAIVYRARYTAAPGIIKPVVIKRVLSQYAEIPAFVEMFIHEARICVGLSHGNIVQVFDFGQVDDEYFLAMELVEGQPLSRVLKRAKGQGLEQLPPPLAVSIAIEMCKGLHHAHTRTDERGRPLGVVHRDVSPDNVLVSYDGEVKITDFGIAKAQLAGRPVTDAGKVKGKFLYLSPEQAQALELDARSDVYAVGVVLYRMLCGCLPVEGQEYEVMERTVQGELTSPLMVNPELDVHLAQIVMRALATSRERRYGSAEEFQEALSRWLATRVPLFTVNALKHLMGWLYAPEVKELGRQPVNPQTFLSQAARWNQAAPGPTTEPLVEMRALPLGEVDESSRRTLPETAATWGLEEEDEVESRRETRPWTTVEAGSGRWQGLGGGVAAVAVLLVLLGVFVATSGPPSLEIRSEPPGAQVRLDGVIRGVTPLVLDGVARDAPHTLELALVGRLPWEHSFGAGKLGRKVEVTLDEAAEPPPPERPPRRTPEPESESSDDFDDLAQASKEGSTTGSEGWRSNTTTKKATGRSRTSSGASSSSAQQGGRAASGPGLKITAAPVQSAEVAAEKYKQGVRELSRGQFLYAKELFWECLAHDPRAARCFRRLGDVSSHLGNTEEALEYYSRFLELEPRGDGSDEVRAFIQQHRGKKGR